MDMFKRDCKDCIHFNPERLQDENKHHCLKWLKCSANLGCSYYEAHQDNEVNIKIDKQKEFATYMFQKIYGALVDENGEPYIEIYQYEVAELIIDMVLDLNTILNIFREYSINDISKIFAIHFWDTDAIVNHNVDDIAFKFDELYGDSIMFR